MKLPPFIKRTEPRRFHYTSVFDEGGKRPISERMKGEEPVEEKRIAFSRKPQQRGILPANVLSLLIGALFLAAIAYFCLIIFGEL